MNYSKNQILTVSIDDIGSNGEGIGRHEGYTLFVKDAVCGDVVEARITKVKKNYAYARCEKILTPSRDRVEPLCGEHIRCGGCQIQTLAYDAQLKYKENKVKNDLIRIGGLDPDVVEEVFEPIIGMDDPKRYRNKSQYPIGTDRSGRPVAGFYAKRTHSIIPCSDCHLAPAENSRILQIILTHMERFGISSYDEENRTGIIRHVLIRKGFATGELMVCLVIKKDAKGTKEFISGQEEFIKELRAVPGIVSICVSVNNDDTNVIMGNEIHTLWGSGRIKDVLLGKTFEISPLSFYQVNPVQTEKLYTVAIGYAALTGNEDVWDVCCGIGTIALCMADQAKYVHGIEIVPEAIEDAKRNAALNGTGNATFICAAAEDYLIKHKDEIKADVVILDPPRKGMDETALSSITEIFPDRIVYVSCDSATLARDIKYLTGKGYNIKKARCTDMFPQTVHV
ncbi:MAG: 23S rRNA (uracil(1939)-C(5))-methyltransferase RlmD, partial [Lachnospiraceae bacterium]|nr:23S rRNA (uracil(1939)-C(5))-methyltransferase RlmD [Lachnospiraceae bacterium]